LLPEGVISPCRGIPPWITNLSISSPVKLVIF
jgi:hypothetical protein